MAMYVKICPRCGHRNDELASACELDGEFLGMVPSVPAPITTKEQPDDKKCLPEAIETPPAPQPANIIHATLATDTAPSKALYLDLEASSQYFQVRDRWTIGQAHPSSTAEIQLANIPGINYVHRRHCMFEFAEGQWYVQPLEQEEYTNPTSLNDKRLTPGASAPLNNGDKLSFAGIVARARIINL